MQQTKFWILTTLFCIAATFARPASAQFDMTSRTSKNKKHFNLNFLKRAHHPHMQHQSDKPQRRKGL
jgi:hypothetical protein